MQGPAEPEKEGAISLLGHPVNRRCSCGVSDSGFGIGPRLRAPSLRPGLAARLGRCRQIGDGDLAGTGPGPPIWASRGRGRAHGQSPSPASERTPPNRGPQPAVGPQGPRPRPGHDPEPDLTPGPGVAGPKLHGPRRPGGSSIAISEPGLAPAGRCLRRNAAGGLLMGRPIISILVRQHPFWGQYCASAASLGVSFGEFR